MKRSGQPKPFRTIGTRMRDFGRSMMRHYVPPQDMPPLFESPPPDWSAAAQTPLVWPEPPEASAGFAAEAPPDVGFDDVSETQDFTQPPAPRRPQRPPTPSQPPLPPSVQRKPSASNVDERLKNILAMHQEREAERNIVREEKKNAFNAAEIQRQADPDAPHRPRRGRMSVDYVETSALSHGEEPPPRPTPPQPVQRESQPVENAAPDESSGGDDIDDTARLDPSVIQASLDEMTATSVQREPAVPVDDFEDDYIPAGDEDAQAFFESPPDWSEDSGDQGMPPPPPIDVPPTPIPPQGSAQRMPDSGDFASQNEPGEANQVENWGAVGESEYPYADDDAQAPPPSDTITLSPDRVQRAYTPDEPDFGGAADFEPSPDYPADVQDVADDSGAEFFNLPSAAVQRDYEPNIASPVADFSAETDNFDQPDEAIYNELPTFDMDESDTRPLDVQRAPILPPPDFVDDMDVPPAETGYNSLADWVDAHSDEPPAPDSPISAQSPGTMQRDFESKLAQSMPVAPDFSLQTGDFNQADFAEQTAPYLDEDEGDTRRMDVQRSFHESDFAPDAGYQPDYSPDYDTEYQDYSEPAAPDTDVTWSGDVDTPPADPTNAVQREYESETLQTAPSDEVNYPQDADAYEVEQGYIEPADARPFFAPPADSGTTAQREYEPETTQADVNVGNVFDPNDYAAAESEAAWSGDVDTPPADTVQREYESQTVLPMQSAEAGYTQDADTYAGEYEAAESEDAWNGDVYTPPADPTNAVQREYEAAEEVDAPHSAPEGQWGENADVYTPPPVDLVQRDYRATIPENDDPAQPDDFESAVEFDAPESDAGWSEAPAETSNTVQRDAEADTASPLPAYDETYADDSELITPEWGWDAAPPADPASYDEQPPVNSWGGDVSPSADTVQRDYESPSVPPIPFMPDTGANADAGEYDDAGDQPIDLYQAMMGAGMVPPDAGWNSGDADLSPGFIQRTPDDDTPGQQPVDLFQAMTQIGMVQPAPDDNVADSYYSPDAETSMSEATRADLLNLLDMPAPRPGQTSTSDFNFTPDVNQQIGGQNTVSRTFEPPPPANPPVVQRAENESEDGQQNETNVDQLARDVYSVLRNRLRIERERRDRKP